MAKEKPDVEWAVYVLHENVKHIGRVQAPDTQSAKPRIDE
jgi:hypothetical protein